MSVQSSNTTHGHIQAAAVDAILEAAGEKYRDGLLRAIESCNEILDHLRELDFRDFEPMEARPAVKALSSGPALKVLKSMTSGIKLLARFPSTLPDIEHEIEHDDGHHEDEPHHEPNEDDLGEAIEGFAEPTRDRLKIRIERSQRRRVQTCRCIT